MQLTSPFGVLCLVGVTQVSKEETKKVEVLNNNLVESLIIQREEVMTVEESLKTTADSLKKQLKDEAHARTVLQVSHVSRPYSFPGPLAPGPSSPSPPRGFFPMGAWSRLASV